jgi:hypothetical protein
VKRDVLKSDELIAAVQAVTLRGDARDRIYRAVLARDEEMERNYKALVGRFLALCFILGVMVGAVASNL